MNNGGNVTYREVEVVVLYRMVNTVHLFVKKPLWPDVLYESAHLAPNPRDRGIIMPRLARSGVPAIWMRNPANLIDHSLHGCGRRVFN
eukprot:3040492-Lingulodinium_polyedra.AAC.1